MDYEDDDESTSLGLSIPDDTSIISIVIGDQMLTRIDQHLLLGEENPEYPQHLKGLPLWALRSNLVAEAVDQLFEIQDITRMWEEGTSE
jgi:hypothetical protein|tara:strand:- start:1183 stop:1449 length:267 start_codon:yes stop_codon:yes gene_type:complete